MLVISGQLEILTLEIYIETKPFHQIYKTPIRLYFYFNCLQVFVNDTVILLDQLIILHYIDLNFRQEI